MKNSLNKFKILISKASNNKKLYVFLSCLCLTIFFWLLNALGNRYSTTIVVDVEYKNNPKNFVILNDLPSQLLVNVSGLGFDLLGYQFKLEKHPVVIDLLGVKGLKKLKNSFNSTLDFSVYKPFISEQLGNQIEVIELSPEKVDVLLDKQVSKLVVIKPVLSLDFENQYQLDGEVKVKPAVVNVEGPKSVLDTLRAVYTEDIICSGLESTTTREVSFNNQHKLQRLSFDLSKVIVFIPVEKFTESSISIPIDYINVPDSIELKAIPNEVQLKFMIPLSKISNITESRFNVNVDYLKINEKYGKLKVSLTKYPDYLKSITIKPSKVEYILKKK
ncbi:MAG: hypothetical protein H6587_10605 [Flavobacteriales bacterium]|nr:hypothetical protein [Flavobacteriales bacterium]MCB9365010.1 hypothetical protein [Flavobacteriales bacterium]